MKFSKMCRSVLAASFTGLASACLLAQQASPLFTDGIDDWNLVNAEAEAFSYGDGVLRVSGNEGWLRSTREYGDFELHGQVRFVEANSDSGIFIRVESGTEFIRGWPGDAYQAQMRDISVNSSDNPLPLANVYRHRVGDGETRYQRDRVFALYTGVGEWQDFSVSTDGTVLTVELNGEVVTEAANLENPRGHIGFQSETGIVEYRNLVIDER